MPLAPMKYKIPMSEDPQGQDFDAPPPEEPAAATPPNLRDVGSEAPICGNCSHFAGAACSKFDGYPVKYHEGCDAHSSLEPEESVEGPDEAEMPMADEDME